MTSLGRSGQPRRDRGRPVDEPLPRYVWRKPMFRRLCAICGRPVGPDVRVCNDHDDLDEERDE